MIYILFFVGLALLIGGAEALVRGSSRLAASVGITPLVVGLTVVAFGTSSPELAVSVLSTLSPDASADIALGNVVGSNIFNVLFILGLAAVISPLVVDQKLVRIDVPLLIVLSVLVLVLGLDGAVGRFEGMVLVAGIVAYTALVIIQGRRETAAVAQEYEDVYGAGSPAPRIWLDVVFIAAGLGMLVLGSRWLVDGAVTMAQRFGVSELIISLTIIAAGTSLPEVATSVLASLRGQRDIAVGNVVGSCIFNLLAVLGVTATVAPSPIGVPQGALAFDLPVMIASALICLPIFFTGYRIGRLEGLLFLTYYAAYVAYLLMAASAHDALPIFSTVMLVFTVPATVVILLVAVSRQMRRNT